MSFQNVVFSFLFLLQECKNQEAEVVAEEHLVGLLIHLLGEPVVMMRLVIHSQTRCLL